MGSTVSRDEVLAGDHRVLDRVPTPEWGEGRCVFVRSLTAGELIDLTPSLEKKGPERLAATVVACACDESGQPLFRDEDLPALVRQRSSVMIRIAQAANKLNGVEFDEGKASPPTA